MASASASSANGFSFRLVTLLTPFIWIGEQITRAERYLVTVSEPLFATLNKYISLSAVSNFLVSISDFFRVTEAFFSSVTYSILKFVFGIFHLPIEQSYTKPAFIFTLTFVLIIQITAVRYIELMKERRADLEDFAKKGLGLSGAGLAFFALVGLVSWPWLLVGTVAGGVSGFLAGDMANSAARKDKTLQIHGPTAIKALRLGFLSAVIYTTIIIGSVSLADLIMKLFSN